VDRDVARADAMRAWREVAVAVLGTDASATRAVRAEKDTLVVVVPTSHWASEIRLRERELVAALAVRAPGSDIARIRAVPESSPQH
jgi:predicted nucleic acid-binding Zn ribbon protein